MRQELCNFFSEAKQRKTGLKDYYKIKFSGVIKERL